MLTGGHLADCTAGQLLLRADASLLHAGLAALSFRTPQPAQMVEGEED